jgi:signal transduction histidine kinase/DNA-binding response OmpR family regulator/ligand-binding sensor domain-containing protein
MPFVVLVALAASVMTARLGSAQEAPTYSDRYFTTRDGLPSQALTGIAQTRDGYLWVVAGGLLSRFDGVVFRSYSASSSALLQSRVLAIGAGLGDTLWILGQSGAVVAFASGRFSEVVPPTPGPFRAIAQDARGDLYAIRTPNVVRFARERSAWVEVKPGVGVRELGLQSLGIDGRGDLWFLDSLNALHRVSGPTAGVRPTLGKASLVSSVTGRILSAESRNGRHRIFDAEGDESWSYPAPGNRRPQLVDGEGRLWVATDTSYEVYGRASERPVAVVARQRSPLAQLHRGAAGCLWETGIALRQICRTAFRSVRYGGAYIGRGPGASVLRRGPVGYLVAMTADGFSRTLSTWEGLRYANAFTDARGVLWWSATAGVKAGLRRSRADNEGVRLLPHRDAYAYAEHDRFSSVLWYVTGTALIRYDHSAGGESVDSVGLPGRVTALSAAADGSVWLTVILPDATSRLLHVEGRAVVSYGPGDGMPLVELRAVRAMDDGSVWVGTYGAGLVHVQDGRVRYVTTRDGLAENVVTSVLIDDTGNLWMGGNQSIHRAPLTQLSDFVAGRRSRVNGVGYSDADGIETPETSGSPGFRDAIGHLWFPTIDGTVEVDPALAVAMDSILPEVRIDEIVSVDDSLPWSKAPLRLTRGARRFTVRYAGVVMRKADAVRYQYRMDGVDGDWVDAGHVRAATYNSVGPGTHTFRVRAVSAAGVPAPDEATVEILVPVFFVETPLFYLLLASAATTLLWGAIRHRERRHLGRQAALSQAVKVRTAELSDALETVGAQAAQLRTLDEAKSRFFANVSHEFRTPLSLLLGPVDDLREGRFGALGAAAVRRLDGVRANAERLLQLVDQLLDIARLQAGALTLAARTQDLVPLLRRMADSFSSLAERKGISFRLSCPVSGLTVSCDADQMEKVVANLVGNALKFTPPGGSVELLATVESAEGAVVIQVVDTGPGIPQEYQARVFERFFQVNDSSTRSHEGTGIGLALVREIVQLHGGTVELQSTVGVGSRFSVRLPLAHAGLRATGEQRRETPEELTAVRRGPLPLPRPRDVAADAVTVLLVEDNADLLEYLREHLADRFRVLVADHGVRGLEMARAHHPDLIVSDVMMPEMDGEALCEAIKGTPETDFIPVILLTARASRDSRLHGLARGADDYLTKPVDLQELVIRIENLVASRRHVRERLRALDQSLPTIQVPLAAPPRDATERALVEKLSGELAKHLADADFDVRALARAMGMGRTTLYRKLTPLLGMSPLDALREYRLAQAAQWLAETPITVSEVAYGVGFRSVPHFSVSFRERYGESPSAFRQARRRVESR